MTAYSNHITMVSTLTKHRMATNTAAVASLTYRHLKKRRCVSLRQQKYAARAACESMNAVQTLTGNLEYLW